MQSDLGEYVKLAEKCIVDLSNAHTDIGVALAEHAGVTIAYNEMKQTIENKKNEMLSAGMVGGKNAEERAANLWVAIAEYDDLQELQSSLVRTKSNLEHAQNQLDYYKSCMSLYTLMIEVLAGLDING